MRIALVAGNLSDKVSQQVSQIKDYLDDYLSVDLLCFGAGYLLGNQSLTGDVEKDLDLAIGIDSKEILLLRDYARSYHVGLGFGFLEKDDDGILYDSYMIINQKGEIVLVHRSQCEKWKPDLKEEYGSGTGYQAISYNGLNLVIASYGDLEYMDNIVSLNNLNPDAIIWPVDITFNATEWRNEGLNELANQLKVLDSSVLLVNSYEEEKGPSGGAYLFKNGNVIKELPLGNMGILIVTNHDLN